MKRALLIGIDEYDNFNNLTGCMNDIDALTPLLARHEDDSPNFDCRVYKSSEKRIERHTMIGAINDLLSPGADLALFYFAGHGATAERDVVLVTQDGVNGDLGVTLSTVLGVVQSSPIREVIIILDCCYSGSAGGVPQIGSDISVLRQGAAILSASRGDQTAAETPTGRGLFSLFFCGALDSGAADALGKVTLAGVYSYLSESFGPWDQRPTFKANLDRLHELRSCSPAVPIDELRCLPEFFPDPEKDFDLDPSFEPDAKPHHPKHEAIFAILQHCRAAKLIEPVGANHMYFAAIDTKACRLTPLGKHYWRMAIQGLL